MPSVAKQRDTAIRVVEEVVGKDLVAVYVSQRDPLSGELHDRPAPTS